MDQTTASSAPTLRSLLEDVAAGRIEPDLAAAVLSGGDPRAAASPADAAASQDHPTAVLRPDRVEILADAVDLKVVADTSVDRIDVDGDLVVTERADGVIEVRRPTRSADGRAYRFGAVGGIMAGWLQQDHSRVVVRVHPDVPLSVATTASRLEIDGFQAGLNVRAIASNVRIDDVRGPFALDVQSSSAKVSALLDRGESTVRGAMSGLELRLMRRSDVAIAVTADMGSARIVGQKAEATRLGEGVNATVGAGSSRLDLTMSMSSAKVFLP
jgi:hypothetical protein